MKRIIAVDIGGTKYWFTLFGADGTMHANAVCPTRLMKASMLSLNVSLLSLGFL